MESDRPLTKAERKALRKQEKQAQREGSHRQQVWRRVLWIVCGILAFLLILYWGYSRYVPIPANEKGKVANKPMETDWVLGNKQAPVVLIEYSDFQCPACQVYQPLVNELKKEYGSQIAVVYRHFPLTQLHPQAQLAAQAAEAAGKQGKFWEMHDKLFENQEGWAESKKAKAIFVNYAKEIGLDQDQFKKDLTSKEVRGLVRADYLSGLENRLNGTPSFFLNGERVQNPQGLEAFREILDLKLKEATTSATIK